MSHNSHSIDGVNSEDLSCLNGWPFGTVGWEAEQRLITLLNVMCKEHGYGRVPQLAMAIEDIWRNPERLADYQEARKVRLEQMAADKKWLEEHKDDPE
jgi:hypothetical protein